MLIEGKRIVITGGSSGIGLETLKQTYEKNELVVIARNKQRLDELKSQYKKIDIFNADFSNIDETKEVAGKILNKYEQVDILINNAAVQYTPKFLDPDFDYESIQKEITTNFTSLCGLIYLLLPAMLKDSRSIILNINSGLGLTPKANSAIYCGTKGAMNIFSQSLRYQLEETNVKVLQAFLPLVDTPMTEGRGTGKISSEEAVKRIIAGLEKEFPENDIGKVKLLRFLLRIFPAVAKNILKRG